jgi:hypothetical protein
VICAALGIYGIVKLGQSNNLSLYAEAREVLLTREHGDEAREAVMYFEQNWLSLEMHKAPKTFIVELLSGPLLHSYTNPFNFQDEVNWLIPSQTRVTNLRIVDYSDQMMKVIACLNQRIDKVDHLGTVIEQYPVRQIVKYYVFILDAGSWKVGYFLDFTDPKQALQDWDFLPNELKDVTGDINSFVYKSCKTEK